MTLEQSSLYDALFCIKTNRIVCDCGHLRTVHGHGGCFWLVDNEAPKYCFCEEEYGATNSWSAIERRNELQVPEGRSG